MTRLITAALVIGALGFIVIPSQAAADQNNQKTIVAQQPSHEQAPVNNQAQSLMAQNTAPAGAPPPPTPTPDQAPAPAPAETPQAAPPPPASVPERNAPATPNRTLPQTGSNLPELALIGVFTLGLSLGSGVLASKMN